MAVLLQKDGLRDGQRRSRDHLFVDLRQRLADLQSCHVRAFRRRPRRRGEYLAIGATAQQPWQQQLVRLVFLPSPRTRPGPRLERSIPEPVMLQDYDFLCRMSFKICFACGGHHVCYHSRRCGWVRDPGVLSPHPTGDLPLLDDRRLLELARRSRVKR